MHSAVGGKAHQVQFLAAGLHIVIYGFDLLVLEELVVACGHIDLDQVLVDDAACAEVHMADLGVAHLSVRKADVLAAGLEMAVRILCPEGLNERSALGEYRI